MVPVIPGRLVGRVEGAGTSGQYCRHDPVHAECPGESAAKR
jgi:hypothetical protein